MEDDLKNHTPNVSVGIRILTYQESAIAVLLYTLISLVATMGNITVLYTVVHFQRMRTPTNFLIANLAVADSLMAALCIPFSYWPVLILQWWPFGLVFCKLINFSQAAVVMCSAYTLIAISFDRFLAIMCPMKTFWKLTPKRSVCVIACIWILAILVAAPLLFVLTVQADPQGNLQCQEEWSSVWWLSATEESHFHYSIVAMVVQYFLPLLVLIVTYGGIGLRLWYTKVPGEGGKSAMKDRQESVKKMIPTMFIVTATYAVCWCPLNVLNILVGALNGLQNYEYILYVWGGCHLLAMFNSMVNPVIYVCKNKKFREGFRYVFRWLPGVRYPDPKSNVSMGTSSEIVTAKTSIVTYGHRASFARLKRNQSNYQPVVSIDSSKHRDNFL